MWVRRCKLLKTAAVVAQAPETRDALARGEVSPRQAAAVAEVEKLSPEKGRQLLADAKKKSAKELETEAAQIVAAASPETDAEKAERHHRARRLAVGTGLDGMGWGSWKLPPAAHARLVAQLEAVKERIFADHRGRDEEDPAAYLADALMALGDRAERAGRPDRQTSPADSDADDGLPVDGVPGDGESEDWSFAKVIVRVDATALDRGELAEGEVCEIAGQGPIPVADAWQMIDGDAFVAALSTQRHRYRQGRAPRPQTHRPATHRAGMADRRRMLRRRLHLEGAPGDRPHRRLGPHRAHRAEPRLAGPCGRCHDLKTHHGWTWGPLLPNGTRRLLPPDEGQSHPKTRPEPDPAPPDDPTPITDAPSLAERAQTPADRARSRTAHPSSRNAPQSGSPSQGGLFDTG